MSSDVTVRTRVLRGPAAAGIQGVSMDTDLSLLRPIAPPTHTTAVDAEAAAAAIRAEASRVGYEDGFAAGQAAGMEEGRAQAAALLERLASAITAAETAAQGLALRQADTVAAVEQQTVTMAVEIAEAVLGRELSSVDAPARDALVRALQLAPKRVDVIARVHPEDEASIGDAAALSPDRMVTVVADAAIERGGCVIDAGPCRIDAQVRPALQRVREVLGA